MGHGQMIEIVSQSPVTCVEVRRAFDSADAAKTHVRFLKLCAGSDIKAIHGDDGGVREYADRQGRIAQAQLDELDARQERRNGEQA